MEYVYCSNANCEWYNDNYEDNCGAPDEFYDQCEGTDWNKMEITFVTTVEAIMPKEICNQREDEEANQ